MEQPLLQNYSSDSLVEEKGSLKKNQPALIRLLGERSGHLVDVIDANSLEAISLESYSTLALCAKDAGKDFILAQVTTADPKDPSRVFHSYYLGHNINKLAFRQEFDLGLLHRMRAKNPLNNMEIDGNISYFSISAIGIEAALKSYEKNQILRDVQQTSQKIVDVEAAISSFNESKHKRSLSEGNLADFKSHTSSSSLSINSFLKEDYSNESLLHKSLSLDMIVFDLRFVGTDEDYLHQQAFRDYFAENSIEEGDHIIFRLRRPDSYVINNIPPFNYDSSSFRERRISQFLSILGCFSYSSDPLCSSEKRVFLQLLIVASFVSMVFAIIYSPPTFLLAVIIFIGLMLIYHLIK